MTENHSFGCIEDQIAMGLHDMSKPHVYQKPKEMTEELKEKFRELFPEYTVKDSEVCLSPYIDIFEAGIEIATKELQEENKKLESVAEHQQSSNMKRYFEIEELKKQIEKMKCCNNCKYRYYMDWKSKCCFDMTKIRDIENPITCKCEKWEIEG